MTKNDVLLIDEDRATVKVITRYLESKGYSCKGVVSGARGLEELKRNMPNVILLDVYLPDGSGFEVCKKIKSGEVCEEIPILYLTTLSTVGSNFFLITFSLYYRDSPE